MGETAGAARFASEAASPCTAAPRRCRPAADKSVRHRLNRRGNRRLNCALHRIAVTQLRMHEPARAYLERRRSEGKTTREALRCLKRHLARSVWRALRAAPRSAGRLCLRQPLRRLSQPGFWRVDIGATGDIARFNAAAPRPAPRSLTPTCSLEELPAEVARLWLGGRGLGTYLALRERLYAVEPLAPENLLVFAPGPLTGTGAPASGRYSVTSRSPLTGTVFDGNSGGNFGNALRRLGWDYLVVAGALDEPGYVTLGLDGAARLRRPAPSPSPSPAPAARRCVLPTASGASTSR